MAHVAFVRSAQNVGRVVYVPVRFGIADPLHPSQHGPLQLAGRTALGEGGTNVVDACTEVGAKGTGEIIRLRPFPLLCEVSL